MGYKLVAIDLDGTLLDPDMKISEKNIDVIRRAIDKGVVVTLSTGRMYAAALPIAQELQLDVPIITCNGAAIICAKSKKIYYEKSLPMDLVLSVLDFAKELGLEVSIYTVDDIYSQDETHNARIHRKIDNACVKAADLYETAKNKNIIKIMFSGEDLYDSAEKVYRRFGQDATFYFSLPWFVEIVAKGVDKGDALGELAGKFNVGSNDIIAIGDNFNDLPMIKYAGLGVAMGNAHDDLKEIADYVTRSYDDDGVAHVFEKFVLMEGHMDEGAN